MEMATKLIEHHHKVEKKKKKDKGRLDESWKGVEVDILGYFHGSVNNAIQLLRAKISKRSN